MLDKISTSFGSTSSRRHLCAVAVLATVIFIANPAFATGKKEGKPCAPTDTACLLPVLEATTGKITDSHWRDQTYREVAKLYAATGNTGAAIAIIPRIQSEDTKALTIRGIGMALAPLNFPAEKLRNIFTSLRREADTIKSPPSHAIAVSYIAMAQAKAKDNEGALRTAKAMPNQALRNKALAQSAEIEAGRNDLDAALKSLAAIDDHAYRNKANAKVANAFADHGQYGLALAAAQHIDTNEYEKAQALLYLLSRQITPGDLTLGIRDRLGGEEE